jgi:hypothetical protein
MKKNDNLTVVLVALLFLALFGWVAFNIIKYGL